MDIVIRATVMFAALYLLIRLLGKRELGQMSPFELVLLIVMGDMIQQGVTHNDFSLTGAILAIATFAFWALVLSWISYLWPRTRKALEGEPRIVISQGKIVEHNLRHDRLTAGELEMEMRLAGIQSVKDVAWAVLEPSGKISFIPRDDEDDKEGDQNEDSVV